MTAGIEWQVHANWAFKARGMYWKLDDLFWSTQQIAANGAIVTHGAELPTRASATTRACSSR